MNPRCLALCIVFLLVCVWPLVGSEEESLDKLEESALRLREGVWVHESTRTDRGFGVDIAVQLYRREAQWFISWCFRHVLGEPENTTHVSKYGPYEIAVNGACVLIKAEGREIPVSICFVDDNLLIPVVKRESGTSWLLASYELVFRSGTTKTRLMDRSMTWRCDTGLEKAAGFVDRTKVPSRDEKDESLSNVSNLTWRVSAPTASTSLADATEVEFLGVNEAYFSDKEPHVRFVLTLCDGGFWRVQDLWASSNYKYQPRTFQPGQPEWADIYED